MNSHKEREEKSYSNLENARLKAKEENGYDSAAAREEIIEWVETRFGGKKPHDWQLDIGEAILLGLDTVAISPTGSGKSLPFIIPLARHPDKKIIIISPLIALQLDMANKFNNMGISTAAVNTETKSSKLYKEIKENKYQVILTSPEMCLLDTSFRPILTSDGFASTILAYVIDEAHCISQWSGDFRPTYGLLDQLRAFVPIGVPILATSATLNRKALAEVVLSLKINFQESFYLNRGNDRPNIYFSTRTIKSSTDYASLDNFFSTNDTSEPNIKKTMVFTNNRQQTQEICRHVRSLLPEENSSSISYFHALRSSLAKAIVMERFRKGIIRVIIATEAAGMGADISNVENVVQFGIAPSLSIWLQRAGRAGRDPTIKAEATMLIEKSVFTKRRKKASEKNKTSTPEEDDGAVEDENDVVETEQPSSTEGAVAPSNGNSAVTATEDDMTYVKKIDSGLREYVECPSCLRIEGDRQYDNPPHYRIPPTGDCCDRTHEGDAERAASVSTSQSASAPSVATSTNPLSAIPITREGSSNQVSTQVEVSRASVNQGSPQHTQNDNGKRAMGPSSGSQSGNRRTTHRTAAVDVLKAWRRATKLELYSKTMWTPEVLLPDFILTKIATNGNLRTVHDLCTQLDPPWVFAEEHGEEVLKALADLDERVRQSHAATLREQREAKRMRVAAEREEEERRKEEERAKHAAERHAAQVSRIVSMNTPSVPDLSSAEYGVLGSSRVVNRARDAIINTPLAPPAFYASCTPMSSFSYDNFFSPPQIMLPQADLGIDMTIPSASASANAEEQDTVGRRKKKKSTQMKAFDASSGSFQKIRSPPKRTNGAKTTTTGKTTRATRKTTKKT